MKGPLLVLSIICWLLIFLFGVNADAQTNQVVINGTSTTAVDFGGAGCVYKWTNSNPAIGLPASGTGDIASFTAINTGTSPVIATITATPQASGFAYIPNFGSGTVSVISTLTNTVVATIPVGSGPGALVISPDKSKIYVVNGTSKSISVISTITNQVEQSFPISDNYGGIVISPDGNHLYVSNAETAQVLELNATTGSIEQTFLVGNFPTGISISPDGTFVYVANVTDNTISIISTYNNIVVATVPVDVRPYFITVSGDGSFLYVSNNNDIPGSVSVISTITYTVITTIPVEAYPAISTINPYVSRLYVENMSPGTISIINTDLNAVVGTIHLPTGCGPTGLSLSPDGIFLYVACTNSNNLIVVNTHSNNIVATINTGLQPGPVGNFLIPASVCNSTPSSFTITVNPTPPASITATSPTGVIYSCAGMASSSPNVQQFNVSATSLNVTAAAPVGFEVSLALGSGYGTSVSIPQTAGLINNATIYVRSASTAPAGNITGNVVLSSAGAVSQNVAVSGTVNALPVVNPVVNQALTEGDASTAVNFTGTADSYTWVNDNPAIGLPANGNGDIPVFTAINTGKTRLIANITITPNANSGCSGTPVSFNISVNPEPPPQIDFDATAFSSLTTSYGTPSTSTSFTLSPIYLRGGILVTPPLGFEVSTDNSTFNSTVLVGQAGSIATITIYIRLASTTAVGHYSGNIKLSSIDAFDTNFGMTDSEVTPAILALKAEDVNKTYGATLTGGPGLTNFTSTGLQNSETIGSVTVAYGAGAAATDPVNTYTGSVVVSAATGGTFSPSNYVINYTPGDIILTPAPLIAAVDNKSKVFDTVNPVFTISYSGFVNNETASVFTAGPVITTTALTNSPAGQYPITASGAEAQNYTITYIPGVLTITVLVQEVVVPNAFTPNGDGINDFWDIKYLNLYPKCIVSVYTRYGERVYSSVGYGVVWDGTYKGAQLPTGTYYYIIDPQSGSKIMSGYITIIR